MADPYLPPGERAAVEKELEECEQLTGEARVGDSETDRQQLLVCLERGLHLKRRLYAEHSPQVVNACRLLCEACNNTAARMLQSEGFKSALALLKRAEEVADKSAADRAVTWNNLAVYYRRTGKLRTAAKFLERALAIEEHFDNADAAQTHLNLCATLSQLQRHSDAIRHAQSALIRIYEVLSPMMLNGELSDAGEVDDLCREQVSVLCIAYHNLAVEHEYLKEFDAALCGYCSGLRWANRFLDPGHQLLGILKKASETVKAKLPQNSAALLRASGLESGFPSRAGASQQSSVGSSGMAPLMTPRGEDGDLRTEPLGSMDEGDSEEDEPGN